MVKHIVNVLFWKWWGRNWDNKISWVKCNMQEWSSVSIRCQPPWSHNSSSSEIKFTCPFQSSSPSLRLRQQLSYNLNHRSLIQSESGVNGLLSLAARGNLLSPSSCFFPVFLIPFPQLNLIIVVWLPAPLHFSEAKWVLRAFSLSASTNS